MNDSLFTKLTLLSALFAAVSGPLEGAPMGSAFTYQGRLIQEGAPATGLYDFQFSLFTDATAGNQVGSTITLPAAGVSNGLFTVLLDFGTLAFNGEARWLQIAVRTNGAASYDAMTPRQALTPTPYALQAFHSMSAASVSWNALSGVPPSFADGVDNDTTYSAGAGLTLAGTVFSANFAGSGSANSVARSDHQHDTAYWKLGGNGGTKPGPQFLGTTDNQPVEIKVNDQRIARLDPGNNVVMGFSGNSIGAGSLHNTIGGGGAADFPNVIGDGVSSVTIAGGNANSVMSPIGFIGGGSGNVIESRGGWNMIGAGHFNRISTGASNVVIGGGYANQAGGLAWNSVIGGGRGNYVTASNATVSGGFENSATRLSATVPGGADNLAAGAFSLAAGRRASALHDGAFVWADSTDSDFSSTAAKQFAVRAGGGVRFETAGTGLTVDGRPVVTGALAENTIFGTNLVDGSVANIDLANNAVTGAKILDGTITAADVAANTFVRISGDTMSGALVNNVSVTARRFFNSANDVSGTDAVAVGGLQNTNQASAASIGGGQHNVIWSGADNGTIGGGTLNQVSGWRGTVGGGYANNAGHVGTVGGGWENAAVGHDSTVAGGVRNVVAAYRGAVGGGSGNTVQDGAQYGTIAGGLLNLISTNAEKCTIGGGDHNVIGLSDLLNTIGGGFANTCESNVQFSVIAGGSRNLISTDASRCTIGGGDANVLGWGSLLNKIGGGYANRCEPNVQFSVIAGGGWNTSQPDTYAVSIGGGIDNLIGTNADYSTIAGGDRNRIKPNAIWGTVGGGVLNVVSGSAGTVPGGGFNEATNNSFAAGRRAKAIHNSAFVWADYSVDSDFASTAPHQFLIRATGGVGINTNNPQAALHVNGTTMTRVLTITGGADLAEPFDVADPNIVPGALVVIDDAQPGRLKLSDSACDRRVAGIVSGANGVRPGITLHQEGRVEGSHPVALSGRVYALADAATGSIQPGDLLTTSDTPGHAMKVTDPMRAQGAIVGKAMTALEHGKGLVLVLVTLQ